MNFRAWLRARSGDFLIMDTDSAAARVSRRYAFCKDFPTSDDFQDFAEYVRQYSFPDDYVEEDVLSLRIAWHEFKQLENTQEVV